jgi:tetratricopeptide (TPR) repeat protein
MHGRRVLILAVVGAALGPGMRWAAAQDEVPYPYPRFASSGAGVTEVEEALALGDRYRDRCFQSALGDAPDPARAQAYATEARGWYRRAEELEPQNAYAQLCIGYVAMIIGRTSRGREQRRAFSEARAGFRQALERRPGYADAYRYLGELDALEEKWVEAEQHFRLLLDSKIEDSHIYAWLGYVLYQQGKKALAEEAWRKARDHGRPAACAEYALDRLE